MILIYVTACCALLLLVLTLLDPHAAQILRNIAENCGPGAVAGGLAAGAAGGALGTGDGERDSGTVVADNSIGPIGGTGAGRPGSAYDTARGYREQQNAHPQAAPNDPNQNQNPSSTSPNDSTQPSTPKKGNAAPVEVIFPDDPGPSDSSSGQAVS